MSSLSLSSQAYHQTEDCRAFSTTRQTHCRVVMLSEWSLDCRVECFTRQCPFRAQVLPDREPCRAFCSLSTCFIPVEWTVLRTDLKIVITWARKLRLRQTSCPRDRMKEIEVLLNKIYSVQVSGFPKIQLFRPPFLPLKLRIFFRGYYAFGFHCQIRVFGNVPGQLMKWRHNYIDIDNSEDCGVVTDAKMHVFYGKVTIMGQTMSNISA